MMDHAEPRRRVNEIDPDLLHELTVDEPTTRPHKACSTADLKGPPTVFLVSFLGHLVLLCCPWVEIQCDQKLVVTRSGFFMATGQPLLTTDREGLVQGQPKHADQYLVFLFVPLAGVFLAAVALSLATRGEQSLAISALLALCGFGLLILRGNEVINVKMHLERMELELGAVLFTWQWLPAFWISFACDLIASFTGFGYLAKALDQDPPARGGTGPPGR